MSEVLQDSGKTYNKVQITVGDSDIPHMYSSIF